VSDPDPKGDPIELKLELVPIPVRDIDRAKAFYADKLGFNVNHDVQPTSAVRVVQLTPPGSACSICLTRGLPALDGEPGTARGLHLVVDDITRVRQHLIDNDVDVEEVIELGGMHYAGIVDPDGNTWTLQQIDR
jgi:catechol 2,3-dioxygenase-like lactoylglutathione lyase family enzyme